MLRVAVLLAFGAFLSAGLPLAWAAEPPHVTNEVIIKFKPGATAAQKSAILGDLNAATVKDLTRISAKLERISGISVTDAVARYSDHQAVEFIEPNYIVSAEEIPNDPRFNDLWGLNNTGQTGGTPGADISAAAAWDVFTGSNVLVGIIDTGVDYSHPDLAPNIFVNPGEVAQNGIDDDGNGFIDDVRGWDFRNNDNNPMDDNGHGTHVAGTIGAVGNNGVGVAGVNWSVKIMPIKFLGADGSGTTADAVLCVQYATMMGVRLTNNSWGGGGFSEALRLAIADAGAAGILFVAAAGNSGTDNDIIPHYPSSYAEINIVAVAATDHNDQLAGFSCFGASSVDLAAPGVNILSTVPGGGYTAFDGTSMATPHVSGVLALIFGRFPAIHGIDAANLLLSRVDPLPSLAGRMVTGGRLNAFNPIAEPDSLPPAAITDLRVVTEDGNWIRIAWTATGDDGAVGAASRYEVRFATVPIDDTNFNTVSRALNPPDPGSSGSPEEMQVRGLNFNTDYYFAVKALDEFGNAGPISNIIMGTTIGPPDIAYSPASFGASLFTGETSTQILTLDNLGAGELEFELSFAMGESASTSAMEVMRLFSTAVAARIPNTQPIPPQSDLAYSQGTSGARAPLVQSTPEMPATSGDLRILLIQSGGDVSEIQSHLLSFPEISTVDIFEAIVTPPDLDDLLPYHAVIVIVNARMNDPVTTGNVLADYADTGGGVIMTLASFISGWQVEGRFLTDGYMPFNLGSGPIGYSTLGDFDATHPIMDGVTYVGGDLLGAVTLAPGAELIAEWTNTQPFVATQGANVAGVNIFLGGPGFWDGDLPLVLRNAALWSANAATWLSGDPKSGVIPGGGSMGVIISFDATGLNGGAYDGHIEVDSNDPDESAVQLPAHLSVTGAPDIALSSQLLDFGPQFLGATPTLDLVVTNQGTDQLSVTSIDMTHTDYTVVGGAGAFTLAPAESRTLQVRFSPMSVGVIQGTMTLHSNDPDVPAALVVLAGAGIEPPDIQVSPSSLTEDLFTGETSTQILTVQNTGLSDLHLEIDSDDAAPLAVPAYHPPNPGGAGMDSRQGSDNTPASALSPQTVSDPSILVIQETAAWGVLMSDVLMNNFNLTPTVIGSAAIAGTDFSQYDLIITVGDESDQYYATLSANVAKFETFVSQGGVVQYQLATQGADVSIAGGALVDYGNFDSLNRVLLPNHPLAQGLPLLLDGNWANHCTLQNLPPGAQVVTDTNGSHQPTTIEYSLGRGVVIATGMTWEWMYGNNLTGGPMMLNAIAYSLSLFGPKWLSLDITEATVPPGGTQNVTVTFDAVGLNGGGYDAVIALISNDPDEPTLNVPAHLAVTGAPDIVLSGEEVVVESAVEYSGSGSSTTHMLPVTITPAAGGVLDLLAEGDYGDSFESATARAEGTVVGSVGSVGVDCAPASGSFPLSAGFLATLIADGTVGVVVQNSADVNDFCIPNRHTVRLRYAGPSDHLQFGGVFMGASKTLSLVVSNAGTDLLVVSSIAVDSPDFTLSATSVSLSPGASQQVELTFHPTVLGLRTGTVIFQSNDVDEGSLSVSLSGEGLIPPEIGVSPTSLSADLFSGQTVEESLVVTNTGGSNLTVSVEVRAPDSQAMTPQEVVVASVARSGILGGPISLTARSAATGETVERTLTERAEVAAVGYTAQAISGPNVALVAADEFAFASDVQAKLLATGRFASVTWINAQSVTPTLAELQAFDAVLVYSRFPYLDPIALGNTLADYVDGGGGVVSAMFEVAVTPQVFPNHQLKGRWQSGIYYVINRSDYRIGPAAHLGTVHLPAHPTMVGVTSFDGGSASFRPTGTSLTPGATLIADWSDGTPLVGVKQIGGSRRADLSFFPPSSAVDSGFWQVGTDGDVLLANALAWTAVGVSWLSVEPQEGTVPPGGSLTLEATFNAADLFGGGYDGVIALNSNDPDEPTVNVPAHLSVTGAPDIALSGEVVVVESAADYLGSGSSTTHALPVTVTPTGGGFLELLAEGDYGDSFERATVTAEGSVLGSVGAVGIDCSPASGSFPVSAGLLSTLIADGTVGVVVQNTLDVNDFCSPNRHTVRLRYAGPADRLEFGAIFMGTSRSLSLMVSNSGTDLLAVGSITVNSPDFTLSAASLSLSPGESQEVEVTFQPTVAGSRAGTMTFTSNDPDEGSLSVLLSGEGLIPPEIGVSPASLSADLYTGETTEETLVVTNTGGSNLTVRVEVMAPESQVMTPGEVVTGSVARSGILGGPISVTTTRATTGETVEQTLTESGEIASVGYPVHAVTGLDVALVAADALFSANDVRSKLLATGRFSSVTWINANVVTPTLAELRAFDAVLVYSNYPYADPTTLGNNMADYVDEGGGVVSAMFEVAVSQGFSNLSLAGRWQSQSYFVLTRSDHRYGPAATLGAVHVPGHPTMEGVTTFDGGPGSFRPTSPSLTPGAIRVADWSDGTPLVAVKRLSRSPRVDLSFYPPSSDVSFDFWQAGTDGDLLMANALEWAASGVTWLSVEPEEGTVPPGESLTLHATFNAADLPGGEYDAVIEVSSNDPDESMLQVPAHLSVTGAPILRFSTPSLAFGDVFVGVVSELDLSVQNVGTDILTVSSVVPGLPDYTVDNASFTLDPLQVRTMKIRFRPEASGDRSTVLIFTSNDPHSPHNFPLSGTGVPPPVITVTPESLVAAAMPGGTKTKSLRICNTGGSDLQFSVNAPSPPPPPVFGPKVAVHVQNHTSKVPLICVPAESGGPAPTNIPCSSYTTRAPVGVARDIYLVAAGVVTNGVTGLSCGIDYNSIPGSGVDVVRWTFCGDGLEFPSDTWPESGSGNRMTWLTCQNRELEPDRIHAIAGAFYVYAYNADTFKITENLAVQIPELKYADCSGFEVDIPVTSTGSIRFSPDGALPGFNPCAGGISVYGGGQLAKGTEDRRTGPPALEGRGGPDQFGYSWTDSDELGGPVFSWVDIREVGSQVPTQGDDGNSGFLPINFPFPYYGNTFDRFTVCTNGWISFTSTAVDYTNQPLPAAQAPENMIAAFWDDLSLFGRQAYYYGDGTKLIVQFQDVYRLDGGDGPFTFQIILYPDGSILLQYRTLSGVLNQATVGMQNGTKDDGLTIAFNTPYLHDNLAISIVTQPAWLIVSPLTGIVPPSQCVDLSVLMDARSLLAGDYTSSLIISSNDPFNSLISRDVLFHVGTMDAAIMDVDPDALNGRSQARWVTAYVELPSGYDPADIVLETVRAMGTVRADSSIDAIGDFNANGIPDRTLKFERTEFITALPDDDSVRVVITGEIRDLTYFVAEDSIRVIRPRLHALNDGGTFIQGTFVNITWEVPQGWEPHHADLFYSLDDGATWTLMASGVTEASHVWRIPASVSDAARISVHVYGTEAVMGIDTSDQSFRITDSVTGVPEETPPTSFLLQNAPNPFSESTHIDFSLLKDEDVAIRVFDMNGRVVCELVKAWMPSGRHQVTWDGRNSAGAKVASGVYLYRMETTGFSEGKRMFLLH